MKNIFITIFLLPLTTLIIFTSNKEIIMSEEKTNLKIVKLIPEMYNGNSELADKIFDINCIHHVNGTAEEGKGPEVIKNSLSLMAKQFSDSKTVFIETISEGNSISVRWTWEAVDIQTQNKWMFNGNTIFHFKNGRITEYWAIDNRLREMLKHGFTLSPPQK